MKWGLCWFENLFKKKYDVGKIFNLLYSFFLKFMLPHVSTEVIRFLFTKQWLLVTLFSDRPLSSFHSISESEFIYLQCFKWGRGALEQDILPLLPIKPILRINCIWHGSSITVMCQIVHCDIQVMAFEVRSRNMQNI